MFEELAGVDFEDHDLVAGLDPGVLLVGVPVPPQDQQDRLHRVPLQHTQSRVLSFVFQVEFGDLERIERVGCLGDFGLTGAEHLPHEDLDLAIVVVNEYAATVPPLGMVLAT